MRPDFLIVGAQKCATSWLHHHLRAHPGVFMPQEKDVELFSYTVNLDDEPYQRWLRRFAEAAPGQRIGDANAAYFWTPTFGAWSARPAKFNPRIPFDVHARLGADLQIIVSLRDPVERAVSAFLHHIHHGGIQPGESLLEVTAPLGIVDMGFYARHLQAWLEVYPAVQVLVVSGMPAGAESAARVLGGVLGFLGLPAEFDEESAATAVFPGIPRRKDETGIWSPADHPSLQAYLAGANRRPRRAGSDGEWVLLVNASEWHELRRIFAADQARLALLLRDSGVAVVHSAPSGEGAA